jgi:hypothetical protein
VNAAIGATFGRRATHAVPGRLDPPPAEWLNQFAELSERCLAGASMSDAFETVGSFCEHLAESEVQRVLDRVSDPPARSATYCLDAKSVVFEVSKAMGLAADGQPRSQAA